MTENSKPSKIVESLHELTQIEDKLKQKEGRLNLYDKLELHEAKVKFTTAVSTFHLEYDGSSRVAFVTDIISIIY